MASFYVQATVPSIVPKQECTYRDFLLARGSGSVYSDSKQHMINVMQDVHKMYQGILEKREMTLGLEEEEKKLLRRGGIEKYGR